MVEQSADRSVVIAHANNKSAVAQEKSIELADQGKREEAVAVLRAAARELRALGDKYNDQALLARASQLDTQADTISREGMSRRSRKGLRSESFGIKNQQRVK
jgi:Ca-activated chloride channel family protein